MQYAFLDSGIGGLPYLRHLKKIEPAASCAYIADIKNFPYGEKSLEEVIELSENLVQKIIDRIKPKLIIIACNTISVSALEHLRKYFSIPFVGTVPAIKPATLASKKKRIAILASERTVNDIYTQNLIKEFGSDCEFFMRADPFLIQSIEENLHSSSDEKKIEMIQPAVNFFKEKKTDAAVLACTHFLHLQKEFISLCAPQIQIIDSLEGVVKQALRISKPDLRDNEKSCLFITKEKDYKKYSAYAKNLNLELKVMQ